MSGPSDSAADQGSVLAALVDLLGALARSELDVNDVLQTLIERAVELARAEGPSATS